MRLFELTAELHALNDLIENDCEFDELTGEVTDNTELLKTIFNELTIGFADKLDGCAYVLASLDVQSKALKDEAKRLNERAKRLEGNSDQLKSMMLNALLELPEAKLKTSKFTFGTRKSESVIIEEGFNMQGKYVRVKETREPDKTAIKEAIKAGETIIGVTIITNKSLNIR